MLVSTHHEILECKPDVEGVYIVKENCTFLVTTENLQEMALSVRLFETTNASIVNVADMGEFKKTPRLNTY